VSAVLPVSCLRCGSCLTSPYHSSMQTITQPHSSLLCPSSIWNEIQFSTNNHGRTSPSNIIMATSVCTTTNATYTHAPAV
jgi:hypothetical protein